MRKHIIYLAIRCIYKNNTTTNTNIDVYMKKGNCAWKYIQVPMLCYVYMN